MSHTNMHMYAFNIGLLILFHCELDYIFRKTAIFGFLIFLWASDFFMFRNFIYSTVMHLQRNYAHKIK